MSEQINTVVEAERVLAELEQRRVRLVERRGELTRERGEIAYSAHTSGDNGASKRLDRVITEAAKHDEHVKALDDAINEAKRRLQRAKEVAAKAAVRARALQVREVLGRFVEAGNACDKALAVLVAASQQLRECCTELNRLGVSHPSHSQLDSLGAIALRTALTQTAWVRYFERVSPMEAKTFGQLIGQWRNMVERNAVAPHLADAEPAATSNEAAA
jgi:hypothetical protein